MTQEQKTNIDKAIEVHLEWVERAKTLTEGGPVDAVPSVSHTECALGQMIDRGVLTFCDETTADEINTLHFLLHDMYKNIYDLHADNAAPSTEALAKAKEYFILLEEISENIVGQLTKCKTA